VIPFAIACAILGVLLIVQTRNAEKWERLCREAWARDVIPRSALPKSDCEAQVGSLRAPIYKPFAIFDATETIDARDYSVLKGGEVIETSPLPFRVSMVNGDRLYLALDAKRQA